MKITCVSDTQANIVELQEYIKNFLSILERSDKIIHLGDGVDRAKPLLQNYKDTVYIRGNHDNNDLNLKNTFEIEFNNVSLHFFHGQRNERLKERLNIWENKLRGMFGYPPDLKKYYTWLQTRYNTKADIIIYGHIHIPKIDFEDNRAFFCPGGLPPSRLLHGNLPSIGVMDIAEKNRSVDGITFSVYGYDVYNKKLVRTHHSSLKY